MWSPGLCIPVLLCGHIGLNKMKHRNRLGISTLNSLLTVQLNFPQKCHEFKPNTELLKTCKCYEHTLVSYFSWNCCLDFVWIFCFQKIWITQASNLEITKKNYGNTVLSEPVKATTYSTHIALINYLILMAD